MIARFRSRSVLCASLPFVAGAMVLGKDESRIPMDF